VQPNLIAPNQAKEIDPNAFREALQLHGCHPVAGNSNINKYGRIVTPINADPIIDPLHQGIVGVLRLQSINPLRNFLATHPPFGNDCH
jgi:hypothetical protein